MPMEQIVEIDGCHVHMLRDGKGPPLVYLHGANGPNLWTKWFEDLAQRFTVIAPDHPSFGASDDPTWLEDIGDLAYFYLDFFKAMSLKDIHLVGHSMGGWLAAEIAIRSTARIKTLTLIAAAGLRVPGHNGVDIFLTPPQDMPPNVYADPKMVEFMRAEMAKPKTEQELDLLIRNRTAAARLCWHPRLNNPQLARWLHRIDVPTHLIWGDSDKIIPPEHGDAYKKLLPAAKYTVIPHCGHGAMVEKPREMVDAVADFALEAVS
jgi:pimeloyl-ACP methyl ester carboxylesterase